MPQTPEHADYCYVLDVLTSGDTGQFEELAQLIDGFPDGVDGFIGRHWIKMLLANGAPVNAHGINDWTPMHLAAVRNDVPALRILVRFGADLTIRTNIDNCATPLEEVRIMKKRQAVEFLESVANLSLNRTARRRRLAHQRSYADGRV